MLGKSRLRRAFQRSTGSAAQQCQCWQVSYAIAAAFNEAVAGGGKGAKRPRAEEGAEIEAAAKPGKGKGGLLEKKSPVTLAKVSY